ncbi:MAG: YceI family protein [Crocinitomicaceae bacterium TMED114]|nr:MAG: YceI family protein [Crocinitomicaceae bacterium TMED114]
MTRFLSVPCFVALVLASCAVGGEGDAPVAPSTGEAKVEKVANPCDCLGGSLTQGQQRYCRESKRDTRFLEQLRKCGMEVGGVSAVNNMPSDGQFTMDPDKSVIQWRGTKVGIAEKGTVPFRSCYFQVQNGVLTGAEVVMEMNAIQPTSQSGTAARELGQHLRSADFFDTANHPTSAFMLGSTRADWRGNLIVDGKLNIKGISKGVEALVSFSSSDPVVASVSFSFNRADFDVRFGSGTFFDNLGDDLISDKVQMRLALVEDVSLRK